MNDGRRSRLIGTVVRAAFVLLLGGIGLARVALAQDEAPEPGAAASAYLSASDGFGPGWKRFSPTAVPNLVAGTFREGAMAAYGGPEGARVVLIALLVDEGFVRRGWEEATTLFENYQYNLAYDYARGEQLRNVPPPPGCAEAKRIDGPDYDDGYLTGITLCAADPDVIVLAVASGAVNDESGFAASDNVVVAALAAGAAGATPEAAEDGGGAVVALEAFDIGWSDALLSASAGDTIRITSTGAAEHSFVVDALGIDVVLAPASTTEVAIPNDAGAGAYDFYCSVPGHAEAGMVGRLEIA
jgi:plastocyanin